MAASPERRACPDPDPACRSAGLPSPCCRRPRIRRRPLPGRNSRLVFPPYQPFALDKGARPGQASTRSSPDAAVVRCRVLPASTATREDRAAWNRVRGCTDAAGCFNVIGTLLPTRARRISPLTHRKTVKRDGVLAIAIPASPDRPPVLYIHRGKPPAKRWIMSIESIDPMQRLSALLQRYIFRKGNFFLICGTNRLQATSKSVIGSESE
jgi:hypothetical protein